MNLLSIPKGEGTKVVIGTRTYLGPDWIHVDIDPFPLHSHDDVWEEVDIVCDAREIPLPDNYADIVFSSECLEHFEWKEYKNALTEWHRILKPGGLMRVEVPDFLATCKQLINMNSLEGDRALQQIFFAEQMNKNDFHFVGLTYRMLTDDFNQLGMEVVEIKHGDQKDWSKLDENSTVLDQDYILRIDGIKR
jgi:predicted SAM-dependent methyltransferase